MFKKKEPVFNLDFVCFGITDACILRCKMCQKWKEDIFIQEKRTAPSLKDWKRCLASLRLIAKGPLQINFGGGEPLLKEDLFEIIRFSKTKRFTANLATSGYLLDEKMAKKIADSGLDSVIISLDSLQEDIHDYLRGVPGVYRQALAAIEHLDQYGKGIYKGICCVLYEKNLDGIPELLEWVDSNPKLNSIYFMAPMQPNNTAWDPLWRNREEFGFLWPKDGQKACGLIDQLIDSKNKGSKITNTVEQLEAFKLYYTHPQRFVKNTKCNLDTALHISACGDIFLCYRWGLLGNIKIDDLAKTWSSQKAKLARQSIAACRENCHFLLNCFFKGDYPFTLGEATINN